MDPQDISSLVSVLHNTPSPVSLLRHYPDLGLPHYWYEAAGRHDPPYTSEEEDAVVEAKKCDPPAADEVFDNIYLGNKAAAEDAEFLVSKGITAVLNLASDTNLKFFVVPDRERLDKLGIQLKEMKLRDRAGENICEKFRESGMWIRTCVLAGGRVMVNCWQGASRSATIVLAYLVQHHKIPLLQALAMIKTKRDIRPNNGFLKQLLLLEVQLLQGTKGNLVDLESERGQLILKSSKEQGSSKFDKISPYFRKQTWKSFCGIQSVCTVLNALDCSPPGQTLYLESMFWEYSISKVVEESVVRRQGMSLGQCAAILNSCPGITATHYRTDETTLTTFRQQVEQVMTTQNNQMIVNYHMESLGQLSGLGGHISPIGGYCDGMALVLDVWPETRESWAPVEDIWAAMDTWDTTNQQHTKRGFIVVKKD